MFIYTDAYLTPFRGNLTSNKSCQNYKWQMPGHSVLQEWPSVDAFFPPKNGITISPDMSKHTTPFTVFSARKILNAVLKSVTSVTAGGCCSPRVLHYVSSYVRTCVMWLRPYTEYWRLQKFVLHCWTSQQIVQLKELFVFVRIICCNSCCLRVKQQCNNLCTLDCGMRLCRAACLVAFYCG